MGAWRGEEARFWRGAHERARTRRRWAVGTEGVAGWKGVETHEERPLEEYFGEGE